MAVPKVPGGNFSNVPSQSRNKYDQGNFIFAPGAEAVFNKPKWKSVRPDVYMIVPPVVTDDQGKLEFAPPRFDIGKDGLANFRAVFNGVMNQIGSSDYRVSFIAGDPGEFVNQPDYEVPIKIFYSTMQKLLLEAPVKIEGRIYKKEDFEYLFTPDPKKGYSTPLPDPNDCDAYFLQVLTYCANDKDLRKEYLPMGAKPNDPANFLLLHSRGTRQAFNACVSAPAEGDNPSNDPVYHYAAGDFTRLGPEGKFFVMYNTKLHAQAIATYHGQRPDSFSDENDDGGGSSRGGGFSDNARWAAKFFDKQLVYPKDDGSAFYLRPRRLEEPEVRQTILEKYAGIIEKFNVVHRHEQTQLLMQAFDPALVAHAVQQSDYLWDDEIEGYYRRRLSLSVNRSQADEPAPAQTDSAQPAASQPATAPNPEVVPQQPTTSHLMAPSGGAQEEEYVAPGQTGMFAQSANEQSAENLWDDPDDDVDFGDDEVF